MTFAGGLLGALLAVALGGGAAVAILRDPLWTIALLPLAAALNAVHPMGGGMAVSGCYRIRVFSRGWTIDGHRGPWAAFLGPCLLAAAAIGGFLAPLPALALAARFVHLGARASPRAVALAGGTAALFVGALTHRRELPFPTWHLLLLAGGVPDEAVGRWLRRLTPLVRPDGSIGHVGGLGADTVGLHEQLDAERVLREAERRGLAGAASLRARALQALALRELPGGGFPLYPGGLPREDLGARAREALGR
ncbi:MAG TPA: hypothetical protein VMB50_15360 [Myxococcales bacterium]|nr:hypothetical protein [Myxococcales bacterium]